ncbi:hypothetical protein HJFPF1_08734 [Paramyrothecium foliicola]|nr:hypothetical protein HJFPF1_08734 [Paramyrothecium foliicola]
MKIHHLHEHSKEEPANTTIAGIMRLLLQQRWRSQILRTDIVPGQTHSGRDLVEESLGLDLERRAFVGKQFQSCGDTGMREVAQPLWNGIFIQQSSEISESTEPYTRPRNTHW